MAYFDRTSTQMEESTHILRSWRHIGQLILIQIHNDGYAHVKIFVHLLVIQGCLYHVYGLSKVKIFSRTLMHLRLPSAWLRHICLLIIDNVIFACWWRHNYVIVAYWLHHVCLMLVALLFACLLAFVGGGPAVAPIISPRPEAPNKLFSDNLVFMLFIRYLG